MNRHDRFLSDFHAGNTYYWHRETKYTEHQMSNIIRDLEKTFDIFFDREPKILNESQIKMFGKTDQDYGVTDFIFNIVQSNKYHSCTTKRQHYGFYVQCALIIIKHYANISVKTPQFPIGFESETDMYDFWNESKKHCQLHLGYGMNFEFDGEIDDMDRKFRDDVQTSKQHYNYTQIKITPEAI